MPEKNHVHRQVRALLLTTRVKDGHGLRRHVSIGSVRPTGAECNQVAHTVLRIVHRGGSGFDCQGGSGIIHFGWIRGDHRGYARALFHEVQEILAAI